MKKYTILLLFSTLFISCSKTETSMDLHFIESDIYGGQRADKNEWQSVVSILKINSRDELSSSFCTGTLIAKDIVITAGHCLTRNKNYYIKNAAVSRDSIDTEEHRYSRIKDISIHPRFNGVEGPWDYAYIKLETEFNLDPSLLSKLATPKELQTLSTSSPVTIVGFGKTETKIKGVKFKANTTITRIDSQEFRAGGKGRDTCSGDSGGPVFYNFNGVEKLIGITSRTPRDATIFCGQSTIYGKSSDASTWFEAEMLYEEALKFNEQSFQKINKAISSIDYSYKYYVLRAKLYIELEKLEEASKDLNKSISLNPKDIESLKLLSNIYLKLDDKTQEEITLKKLLKLTPNDDKLFSRLLLISQKDEVTLIRAQGYFSWGQYQTALELLNDIKHLDQAKYLLGFAKLKIDEPLETIKLWSSIVDKKSVYTNTTDSNGDASLFSTIKYNSLELSGLYFQFNFLPSHQDSYGTLPTQIVWTQKRLELLKLFTDNGIPFNTQRNYDEFLYLVKNSKIELIEILINLGIDFNVKGRDGLTAKELALKVGNPRVIELFEKSE